jgi:hypothetical protein
MKARVFGVVAAASFAAAGVAWAAPPSGPPSAEPNQPIPAACSFPHPTAACFTVQMTCPSNPRMQIACRVTGTNGAVTAHTHVLVLRLPRAVTTVSLLCRTTPRLGIACRVTASKTTAASGTRTVRVLLPKQFTVTHILCRTNPREQFACRVQGTS